MRAAFGGQRVPNWQQRAVAAFDAGDVTTWRTLCGYQNPAVGVWWDEPSVCSVCGPAPAGWERVVQDHCHLTGLARGRLCYSCNTLEGYNSLHGIWPLWNETAPWLAIGQRWFYGNEGRAHRLPSGARLFTEEQLLTWDMQVLLPIIRQHMQPYHWRNEYAMSYLAGRYELDQAS